jgi:predicted XRE-type DNA-binding protein
MKPGLFHPKARAVLRSFPDDVRRELGKAIFDLQKGAKLSMPLGDAMKKVKPVVARNAKELAKALGLTPADAVEFEIRSALNDKIIEVVNERGLTHAQVATLSHTSRTRVTAILNRNTHDISTDLMLRVLGSLGVQAKLQFTKAA